MNRRTLLACAASLMTACNALAQTQRTVRMIVPFTPGSPNDVIARLLAQHLATRMGQSVIVDNRPGAGTTTGMKAAAIAEPDGNTLLFQSSSLVVAPAMYANLDYDPFKAFVPVANAVEGHWVTVVPPDLPVNSIRQFIAYAKANPGKLNFGFGQGTAPQLVGEWLKATNQLDVGSVPYRGGAQAITDMLGGRIQLNIGTITTLTPLIKEGKLKALSVWGPTRYPDLPGRTDHDRKRLSRPVAELLGRALGAGRHAGTGRRQAQRRYQRGARRAGHEDGFGQAWRRGKTGFERGFRGFHRR